jgi:hypothetical protein
MPHFFELGNGFLNLDQVVQITPFPNGYGAALYLVGDDFSGEGIPVMGEDWHLLRSILRKNFPNSKNPGLITSNGKS